MLLPFKGASRQQPLAKKFAKKARKDGASGISFLGTILPKGINDVEEH
jgi:hypothetical protein